MPRLSEEAKRRALERCRAGERTVGEVAQEFGVNPSTIVRLRKKHGLSGSPRVGRGRPGLRKLSPAQEQEVLLLRARKVTYRKIAERFGVSIGAVQKAEQRRGGVLQGHSVVMAVEPDVADNIVCRYVAGEHGTDLAEEFGISDATVYRYLGLAGIERRPRGADKRRLTDAQEEEVALRYLEGGAGTTYGLLGETFGISRQLVRRVVLRQLGGGRSNREAHAHQRALSGVEETLLGEDYLAGDGQIVLARRYGVAEGTVRAVLRRLGISQRSQEEVNAPRLDVPEAIRLYQEEGLTEAQIGERLDVSQSVVNKHLRRAGVEANPSTVYRRTDHHYFDVVDIERAYFAGFLAADGCVVGNSIKVGLARFDRCWLEMFARVLGLQQPIFDYVNNKDRLCSGIVVTSKYWREALERLYGIVPAKAKTLQPPPELADSPEAPEAWAFVRGYFDGDGHARKNNTGLQITSGSRVFLEWVIRSVMGSYHSIHLHNDSWGCGVTGPVFRRTVPLLYAGSTPDTRLARKYERLKCWLPSG